MIAVELVGLGRRQIEVGDKGVISPVRPQRSLGGLGEPGSAHDEPYLALRSLGRPSAGHVEGLGNLGFTAVAVDDGLPRRLADGLDCGTDVGVYVDRDREAHPESPECVDE